MDPADPGKRDRPPRECPGCHASFVPRRVDQLVCSSTCRQRKRRGTYVPTDADRAAIRKVLDRDGHGHPLERPLTKDEVERHVLLTFERT